jgi:4-hydroxybenzoate polyprenyltransferase
MKLLGDWLRTLRPKQWTKNGLVFAALLFAHQFTDLAQVGKAFEAFLLFCALASSVYVFNDCCDLAEDRRHPLKCHRPLASGALPIVPTLVSAFVLAMVGLGGFYLINLPSFILAVSYLVLQAFYSFRGKHLVIIDVLCVAAGFVIRAAIGATVLEVVISPWLLICTVLLALFLAITKRRQEIVNLGSEGSPRAILKEYSLPLLDQMVAIVTASTLMSYALYTISDRTVRELGTDKLMYTLPFVIYGIFRYLYLVHQRDEGEAPDKLLLNDGPLLADVLLYAASVVAILLFYGTPG